MKRPSIIGGCSKSSRPMKTANLELFRSWQYSITQNLDCKSIPRAFRTVWGLKKNPVLDSLASARVLGGMVNQRD